MLQAQKLPDPLTVETHLYHSGWSHRWGGPEKATATGLPALVDVTGGSNSMTQTYVGEPDRSAQGSTVLS